MTHWETLWTFKTPNFRVELACTPETDPDLSWDDTGEVTEKLNSGEYVNVTFRVRVYGHGLELGEDYLGNSIYADPREFRDHIGSQGRYGSYFVDMVHQAIGEARKSLRSLQSVHVRQLEDVA